MVQVVFETSLSHSFVGLLSQDERILVIAVKVDFIYLFDLVKGL